MIKDNRNLNYLFDVIINKDMFDYSEDDIYTSLINSFANEIHVNDIKVGETIMIFTEDVPFKYNSLKKIICRNKYADMIEGKCNDTECVIELKVFDTDRLIKIRVKDIKRVNDNCRGFRSECMIIDVDNNDNYLFGATEEKINSILKPINIYAKDYKPCHGMMLFYRKKVINE